jgi:hypothetical protein
MRRSQRFYRHCPRTGFLVMVGRADQIRQRLRIVDGGIRDVIVGDQRWLGVRPNVVLITKERSLIFLRPARIQILLAELVRLLFSFGRPPPCLINSFSSRVVALLGYLHETGVHNGADLRDDTLFLQDRAIHIEQRFDRVGDRQGFAEKPHGGEIRPPMLPKCNPRKR